VKVIDGGVEFKQTVSVPEIVAVGNGFTVTVAAPVGEPLHTVLFMSTTPVRLKINVPVDPVGTSTVATLEGATEDTV
jgi:hypothetical protein